MTAPYKSPFLTALEKEMAASRDNDFADNYDTVNLGAEPAAEATTAWRRCIRECVYSPLACVDSVRRMKNYYLAPEPSPGP